MSAWTPHPWQRWRPGTIAGVESPPRKLDRHVKVFRCKIMASNGKKVEAVAYIRTSSAGVWTALSTGDGGFAPEKFVRANFGANEAWTPLKHIRLLADINNDRKPDIVGFGDAGVWTTLSTGDGGFAPEKFVLANFGFNQGWRADMLLSEAALAVGAFSATTTLAVQKGKSACAFEHSATNKCAVGFVCEHENIEICNVVIEYLKTHKVLDPRISDIGAGPLGEVCDNSPILCTCCDVKKGCYPCPKK
jgi:hypothetical protein